MNKEFCDIRYIKGVGEKRAEKLQKLGINTLYDLVHFYPRSYIDYSSCVPISALIPGQVCTFRAHVGYTPQKNEIRRGMTIYKSLLFDGEDSVHLNIFNNSYLAESLQEGEEYIFNGKIGMSRYGLEITNPNIISTESDCLIQPIYPQTAGLTSKVISKIIRNALEEYLELTGTDTIPDEIRRAFSLCHEQFALKSIHFPKSNKDLEIARTRLIFEELLTLQAGMRKLKNRNKGNTDYILEDCDLSEFLSSLSFTLTNAQKKVIAQCISDMQKNVPMNRLVQGDVGSGKTVVAAALMFLAAKNKIQSAFMAPTEILARQHFNTLSTLMGSFGFKAELLTGSVSPKEKKRIRKALESGETDFVVGTHAILTKDVSFSNLGLIITDEQHRFGVNQRGSLAGKGNNPHTLVMSATPIPRTLSLIIYGDLDLSIIDELPKGRQKISTYAVDTSYHERIYAFIKKHLDKSLQAYIVCPLVDESDESELTAATEYAQKLSEKHFANYSVGLLHGKMKPKEKEQVMADFVAGKIQLLVSTVVIEVGVDVPNSVIMVIEDAERFGLSQLHQLRGRVGRGTEKSYCVLVSNARGETAKSRLEIMCRTNDGFVIADKDLELRGPGDFFGSRQHGLPELKIADFTRNMDTVRQAKTACDMIFEKDPELCLYENRALRQAVARLFTENEYLSLN